MQSKTDEKALEAAIEKALTGRCLEELKTTDSRSEEAIETYGSEGYYVGYAESFDAKYAIDTIRFWNFLETSQKEELEKLKRASDWKLKILERFHRLVKKYGVLRLLRKGLEVEDAHLSLLYPLHMVVFINGIPIATVELKNPWTGQNSRVHGIKQYKYDRDFHQPLLNFGRCLVHFAVDTEEVYMTTKLNGGKTFFLPFNKRNL